MKLGLSHQVPIFKHFIPGAKKLQNGLLRRPRTNVSFCATDNFWEAWEETWRETGLLRRKCDPTKDSI